MNREIREMIRKAGIFQWQVAREIGITEGSFIRWLRDDPLPADRRDRILQAINDVKRKKEGIA